MKYKLRSALALLVLLGGLAGILSLPSDTASAQAAIKNNVCGGAEFSLAGGGCAVRDANGNCVSTAAGSPAVNASKCDSEGSLNKLIANIVNILSIIVGIVAVIMIIIGGFKYITSGGDSGSISSAKTTVIYALVGLVIVALAQVIVRFVLAKAT